MRKWMKGLLPRSFSYPRPTHILNIMKFHLCFIAAHSRHMYIAWFLFLLTQRRFRSSSSSSLMESVVEYYNFKTSFFLVSLIWLTILFLIISFILQASVQISYFHFVGILYFHNFFCSYFTAMISSFNLTTEFCHTLIPNTIFPYEALIYISVSPYTSLPDKISALSIALFKY